MCCFSAAIILIVAVLIYFKISRVSNYIRLVYFVDVIFVFFFVKLFVSSTEEVKSIAKNVVIFVI